MSIKSVFITIITFPLFSNYIEPSNKQNENKKLYCIQAKQIFPIYNSLAKLVGYDTSLTKVFFYGSKILYEFPYKQVNSINGRVISIEHKSQLFIQPNTSNYGYEIDENLFSIKQKVPLDSVFDNHWLTSKDIFQIIFGTNHVIVESKKDNKLGLYYVSYMIKTSMDTNYKVRFYLTFTDSLPWLHLSLTRQWDSMMKMRLIKMVGISPKQFFKPINKTMDGYTYTVTIQEIPVALEFKRRLVKCFDQTDKISN